MRVSVHLLRCVYPWRSEGQVAESVLSLHLIGPRVGTQIPLSHYPLSYLASISPFGFVCVRESRRLKWRRHSQQKGRAIPGLGWGWWHLGEENIDT